MPSPLALIKTLMQATSGPARESRIFHPKDLHLLQNELAPFVGPRRLPPEYADSLTSLLKEAENEGTRTHLLYGDLPQPLGAFQLTDQMGFPGMDTYLPNLISFFPGVGRQAISEARTLGPYGLVATPYSRGFYDRMVQELPRFENHPDPDLQGVAYMHKKSGGLI